MPVNKTQKKEIYARDNGRCRLCRKPVELYLPYDNPYRSSVDHILPQSLGGSDDNWNLRLAHAICNGKRSNIITQADRRDLARNLFIDLGIPSHSVLERVDEVLFEMQPLTIVYGGSKASAEASNQNGGTHDRMYCGAPGCKQEVWIISGHYFGRALCEPHARERYRGT